MRWFEDGRLRFALGLEDTFIPHSRVGERALDEYELTQHYRFWSEDLGLCAESGATMLRWGIPWYRVNPERGRWDWSWLDRVVDRFEELGIEPIVDLMHYGTPLWLDNQFANHDYPRAVAEYAARVAERYRGRLRAFTPLNEPLLNIIYCGEFGYWPPNLTGDDGFVTVLRGISRGIVLTQQAIAEVAADDVSFVHVEASFRFAGDLDAYPEEAAHLRERAFLVEDLVTGRVGADHALVPYLQANGFTDTDLAWARENVALPDVMGVNYYPGGQTELFVAGEPHTGGPLDPRPRENAWTEGLADVLTSWADRYGCPVMLTETAFGATDDERARWLDDSVAEVRALRGRGVDVVGYTWWSLIDMAEWSYRPGSGPAMQYMLPMGLWRLEEDGAGALQRVRTPLVDQFRAHALADRVAVSRAL